MSKDISGGLDRSAGAAHVDSLARRFAAGDSGAANEVRARARRILAFRGYGIPAEERLDLEQTVVLEIWRAVKKPDFDTAGFWGFVEIVASRRCVDWFRSRKKTLSLELELESEDSRPDPLARALTRERADLANAVLAQLSKPCRELIYLRAGLNNSFKEISELLGVGEGALRVRLHRCIQEASRLLAELETSRSRPE